jgi:hypothetical protein
MVENIGVSVDPANRHALYYPYIHIRNENWLKGAILGFQQVRRLVPDRFTVKDQTITSAYAKLEGPAGPLLDSVVVAGADIKHSQTWLRARITENLDVVIEKYARPRVPMEFQSGARAFQMYVGKILDEQLLDLLTSKQLGWFARERTERDSANWITMHPKLGAAIMSVLAITVARTKGLSVVTPSILAHYELLANREEDVFNSLLEIPTVASNTSANVSTEELSHLVVTMGFDLTRLSPKQICELLKQGKDLRSFRKTVSEFANHIPPNLDGPERNKRMKQEADLILQEWSKYTGALPQFAKDALVDAAFDEGPSKLLEIGVPASIGVAATSVIGALPGLLVAIGINAGIKMFRKRDSPLRFLSRVDNAVQGSIGSIYVPQWRALADQTP